MKIGVVGCMGRMGQVLVKAVMEHNDVKLSGGTERAESKALGKDLGLMVCGEATGHIVSDEARALFEVSDTVIDFTTPAATLNHASLAIETGTALVVGTTGMSVDEMKELSDAADTVCIVQAGNMSVGINLLTSLVCQMSAMLGIDYDIEVVEMHHRNKVDAPSGTALMLGEAAALGRGMKLDKVAQFARNGIIGPRPRTEIGFASLRGGDVVGEHKIIFASEGERIELSHKAGSRKLFANGAIRAALWTKEQKPGLYSMKRVLNID